MVEPAGADEILDPLNDAQREAVTHGDGPALVIAGAGSGKTRVLTHRIAHLMRDRHVSPHHVLAVTPHQVLAITFTNKAAEEMKERLRGLVGPVVDQMWVSTFHRACVRILRHGAERIDYPNNFTIYDTTDQGRLVRQATIAAGIDPKRQPVRATRSTISNWKNHLLTPAQALERAEMRHERTCAEIYEEYQSRLRAAGAMDFDDLLMQTVRLLREDDEARNYHQQRWHQVLVDEFQDTNAAQFELVRLWSGKHRNLFVVGDNDQSIYRFRGADISNVTSFERHFVGAQTYKLEQNYRSSQNILSAANFLIANNESRYPKALWTDAGEGLPVVIYGADNDADEASFIARQLTKLPDGVRLADAAIFYRTNAQSRALEEALFVEGIPYVIVRGTGFYDRAEIKDAMAFIRAALNEADNISVERIVNKPARGVGKTSLAKIAAFAESDNRAHDNLLTGDEPMTLIDAMRHAAQAGVTKAALRGIGEFLTIHDHLRDAIANDEPPSSVLQTALTESGYLAMLEADDSVEAQSQRDNLHELIHASTRFDTCEEMCETIALISDSDMLPDSPDVRPSGAGATEPEDRVSLMTLHTAKGLEYDTVFFTGLEEGLCPHSRSMTDPDELEEERRLAYVGITRAKRQLFLTYADDRYVPGSETWGVPSRFLNEIPDELIEDGGGRVIGRGVRT